MAELKDKVQNALDEARMLILGAQLLLGFQLRSFLEPGFERLPFSSQLVKLCGLWLILMAIVLLIAPTAYHRVVERGEDTREIHRYTTRVMTFALLPFALALAADIFIAASGIVGRSAGAFAGFGALVVALFFWYGLEAVPHIGRGRRAREVGRLENEEVKSESVGDDKEAEAGKLKDRIKHVLTEARTVLPGAQALLGFQLISTLMESFEKLPIVSKYIHLASLALVGLSVVLLMTPAAYHRIAEEGEESEHFHRFAGRMVVAALVPLALGICGSVYVVVQKVIESRLVAGVAGIVMLAVFYEFWFGLPFHRRVQRQHEKPRKSEPTLFGA